MNYSCLHMACIEAGCAHVRLCGITVYKKGAEIIEGIKDYNRNIFDVNAYCDRGFGCGGGEQHCLGR